MVVVLLTVVFALCPASEQIASAQAYSVSVLSTNPVYAGYALNNLGWVGGCTGFVSGAPALFTPDIDCIYGLNDKGEAVGQSQIYPTGDPRGSLHAMLYDGETTIALSLSLGLTGWTASAINNSGQVVIYSASGISVYSGGTAQHIPGTGYYDDEHCEINDNGVVVGSGYEFGNGAGQGDGWYYDGALHDLGPNFFPQAINNAGQIAGVDLAGNVVLDTDGTFQTLGALTPGQIINIPQAIGLNDLGEAAFMSNGSVMLYDNGTLHDLTGAFLGSGVTPDDVTAINDAGQILVNCLVPGSGGSPAVALMTPVPEPSTLVLAGIGGVSLFAYAWRRRIKSGVPQFAD
jgi:hypothetical protein